MSTEDAGIEKAEFESREQVLETLKTKRDLTGADLSGLDLSGIRFLGAKMPGARLCDADLTGCMMAGVWPWLATPAVRRPYGCIRHLGWM